MLRRPTVVEDLQPFGTGEDVVDVTAHVIREGLIRDSPYGGKQESVDVETEQMRLDDRVLSRARRHSPDDLQQAERRGGSARERHASRRLRVYRYGERLHLTPKLRLPHNYRNPGAMDMAGYLASQGIRMTGSAAGEWRRDAAGFRRHAASDAGAARLDAARWNTSIRLWPGERGALMQAALIGGRAFFGRDIKTDFQRTGTYHILVVSGINVGILAFAVFWLLRSLPFGETWATVLTIAALLGLRFRRRSRLAHRARHHHAQHLPAHAIAVSRPRRAKRAGHRGTGNSAGQSANAV